MSDIIISNLRKEYGIRGRTEVAVDGVSLTIEDGEFVSILGPSGCGKTTTLRCIGGLEMPTDGRIEFDDVDVTDVPANKRDLAMMFQDIALYPHMTVEANIGYPLKIDGIPESDRRDTVREAAELMRIDDLLDKHPGELSGGQQQRAALARTLVQDPIAFLMDEPLSDLDAQLKTEMRKEIQRVHKRLSKPTIYVTHDQQEAITMSDRIVVLNEGQIEQVGTPQEIYDRPNNTFVASFVGNPSINYLDATVAQRDDDAVLITVAGEQIRIPVGDDSTLSSSDEVQIGIRPQSVGLTRDVTDARFEGEIFLLEPVGDRVHATLETADGELRALLDDDTGFEEGQQVGIEFDAPSIHVFDSTTHERIPTSGTAERVASTR